MADGVSGNWTKARLVLIGDNENVHMPVEIDTVDVMTLRRHSQAARRKDFPVSIVVRATGPEIQSKMR